MTDKTTQQDAQSASPRQYEITTADRFRKAILAAAIMIGIGWAFGF